MAFPETILPITVELIVPGVGNFDITADVNTRGLIRTDHGKANEQSSIEPSRCTLELNNGISKINGVVGRYSPQNPNSDLYGTISRNTTLRVTVDSSVRFTGEVAEWPSEWDKSGNDVWVLIEAAGVLRRLLHGNKPLASALRRGILAQNDLTGYWPFEDGPEAVTGTSALDQRPDARTVVDLNTSHETGTQRFDWAANSAFDSSQPLPVQVDATAQCRMPYVTDTGDLTIISVLLPSHRAYTGFQNLLRIRTSSVMTWNIVWEEVSDSPRLEVEDEDGRLLLQTLSVPGITRFGCLFTLKLSQAGADITWSVQIDLPDDDASYSDTGTILNSTLGVVRNVVTGDRFNVNKNADGDPILVTVGHVATLNSPAVIALPPAFHAHRGEKAGYRFTRVLDEENIPHTLIGTKAESEMLGPQLPTSLPALLSNLADTDMGFLHDKGELTYRLRTDLYNQPVALTVDYAAGDLASIPVPVPDDGSLANKITVSRSGGGSYTVEKTTGTLSTQDPPNGVGTYETSPPVDVPSEALLPDQAGWRLHLGTIDEPRFPSIKINLARRPGLMAAVKALRLGDRIQVLNPPRWVSPDTLDLIVQGMSEQMWQYEWTVTLVCTPASAYTVGVRGTALRDTSGSELTTGVTATGTKIDVSATSGAAWTTDSADLPLDIRVGGEVMTVTNIGAGADSVAEDFEDATLNITITNGGDAAWARSSAQAHAGAWSLESGAIVDSQTSDAIVTVPTGALTCQFWYRVSSEADFDFFRFLVDGVQQFEASGETGWVQSAAVDVSTASTVTFRYIKDASVSGGSDAAWVDDVVFAMSQEFTVTRSVNGVVKSHNSGAGVSLANPARRALTQTQAASDLVDGDIIGGLDYPLPADADEPTNEVNIAASTPGVPGDMICGVSFIAPTSGRVLVFWHARLESDTGGTRALALCAVRKGGKLDAGTLVKGTDQGITVETNDRPSTGNDTHTLTAGMQYYFLDGLDPGQEYNAVMYLAQIGGGTATFFHRSITAMPIP